MFNAGPNYSSVVEERNAHNTSVSITLIFVKAHPEIALNLVSFGLATAAILGLALNLHIVTLAEWTSRIILLIFAIVCLSLLRLKLLGEPAPEGTFRTPAWVPAAGVIACLALLGLDLLFG
jgi:hypothetical protein